MSSRSRPLAPFTFCPFSCNSFHFFESLLFPCISPSFSATFSPWSRIASIRSIIRIIRDDAGNCSVLSKSEIGSIIGGLDASHCSRAFSHSGFKRSRQLQVDVAPKASVAAPKANAAQTEQSQAWGVCVCVCVCVSWARLGRQALRALQARQAQDPRRNRRFSQ